MRTLEDLLKGKMKETLFPFVDPNKKFVFLLNHWYCQSTTTNNNCIKRTNQIPQDIIIFFVGGTTYEEYKFVSELCQSQPHVRILLGGTTVHNSARFPSPSVSSFAFSSFFLFSSLNLVTNKIRITNYLVFWRKWTRPSKDQNDRWRKRMERKKKRKKKRKRSFDSLFSVCIISNLSTITRWQKWRKGGWRKKRRRKGRAKQSAQIGQSIIQRITGSRLAAGLLFVLVSFAGDPFLLIDRATVLVKNCPAPEKGIAEPFVLLWLHSTMLQRFLCLFGFHGVKRVLFVLFGLAFLLFYLLTSTKKWWKLTPKKFEHAKPLCSLRFLCGSKMPALCSFLCLPSENQRVISDYRGFLSHHFWTCIGLHEWSVEKVGPFELESKEKKEKKRLFQVIKKKRREEASHVSWERKNVWVSFVHIIISLNKKTWRSL